MVRLTVVRQSTARRADNHTQPGAIPRDFERLETQPPNQFKQPISAAQSERHSVSLPVADTHSSRHPVHPRHPPPRNSRFMWLATERNDTASQAVELTEALTTDPSQPVSRPVHRRTPIRHAALRQPGSNLVFDSGRRNSAHLADGVLGVA